MGTKADRGWEKIKWAQAHMPINKEISSRFEREQPFAGLRIGAALHLEAKTANLILTLRAGGAELYIIGSNPLSTQDEIVAAISETEGITVSACHGEAPQEHEKNIDRLIDSSPDLIVEDGGDVVVRLHERNPWPTPGPIGVSEETTTGVERLRELSEQGKLRLPAIAVNDAQMKHLFDNRYGTGQSTWDAIMRATNLLVAGKSVLIVGYGWCGKGLALRAHGLGARVLIAELDPVKAVEARMEGHEVVSLTEGMERADFVVTATGRDGVREEELARCKDGAVLANAGHFGYEIDKDSLTHLAREQHKARDGVEAYTLPDGRSLYLLGEGELVNPGSWRWSSRGDHGHLVCASSPLAGVPCSERSPAFPTSQPGTRRDRQACGANGARHVVNSEGIKRSARALRYVLTECKIEPELTDATPSDCFQFERKDYFCIDPDSTPENPVFNRTVTLRDTWAKIQKKQLYLDP